MNNLLVVDKLTKSFHAPQHVVTAVDQVSFDVRQGQFISVIGPSGCGKSTLFGIIGGLVDDYQGQVRVNGAAIEGSHRDIGMVFQEESTFPWLTALENVEFALEVTGYPRDKRRQRAEYFLHLVGLDGFENRYPSELSGGMRSRTAIARTLASEPKILLMDEPFASLDEQTRLLLGDKILQIWRELNQTTLLITHSITEAVQLSDRIIVMTHRPGRVKRIVDVNLPRPRSSDILGSEQFGKLVGTIWTDLREEATRGMIDADDARARRPGRK